MEFTSRIDFSLLKEKVEAMRAEAGKILVGQQKMLDLLLIALLAEGHVLLEGVPGVAKTLSARLLARLINADFKRIQFTPDLMPSDILGTNVFNQKTSSFDFHKGPLFTNIALIDEINRSPAKTQAALFEVMEERQITLDGTTYPMDGIYMAVATQNPIEQEGTYRLPEAQLDRFLFKIEVNYPSIDEEKEVIMRHHQNKALFNLSTVEAVISIEEIIELQSRTREVQIDSQLVDYIAKVVHETRSHKDIYLGASPRASIAILQAAKASAALNLRDFVTPEDIKFVAVSVLQHRIILAPEAEMEGIRSAEVCRKILNKIEIPR